MRGARYAEGATGCGQQHAESDDERAGAEERRQDEPAHHECHADADGGDARQDDEARRG